MKDAFAGPAAATQKYLRTSLAAIAFALIVWVVAPSVGLAQESKPPDRYTEVANKLLSLTKLPLSDCRWHADVAHPEDGSLDDSAWKPISLGANFESGAQVFRCWFTVPQKVNGYDVCAANLKFAMDLQGDGMTMLSIYSNNYSIYRGNADTLEPVSLTTNAQPGQRFLVVVRLEVGDQPRKLVRLQTQLPTASAANPESHRQSPTGPVLRRDQPRQRGAHRCQVVRGRRLHDSAVLRNGPARKAT